MRHIYGQNVLEQVQEQESLAIKTVQYLSIKVLLDRITRIRSGCSQTLGFGKNIKTSYKHIYKRVGGMQNILREEYVDSLRRRSNGFSRGISKYRGVSRNLGANKSCDWNKLFGFSQIYLVKAPSLEI
ncbi:hypothetical protein SUGI_0855240 [Cryptomeria japonica]|nr:hypothetical protein SUGI_0855240 [Cryptomeria japonica]